ncbi:MAG: hypothetical protein GDA56_25465 [Hormoscilla sp. GM7CHS1pb]|nr:hypothetical protein [Hormoscilla sp. GM7CHS1pb]
MTSMAKNKLWLGLFRKGFWCVTQEQRLSIFIDRLLPRRRTLHDRRSHLA